ncbi:hypothetical protein FRC01_007648 [Tulasnella sp. 417]|nr:hypothetical protein FRC01_007648 [Tulasnella sp. 417]
MSTLQSAAAQEDRRPIIPKPPYDLSSSGDCILCSSDGVQFKVYRNILSLASTVFADMFSMPQGPTTSEGNISDAIQLTEDSHVLQTLLTLLYPVEPPIIDSYDIAADLIVACDKYGINVMLLKPHLDQSLQHNKGLEMDPLGVYAIAWRLGLEEDAKNASRYTHTLDLLDHAVRDSLIRRSGSIDALLALHDLRLKREIALDNVLTAIHIERRLCSNHLLYGSRNTATQVWMEVKTWLRDFFMAPFPDSGKLEPYLQSRTCGNCPMSRDGGFSEMLKAALDKYPYEIKSSFVV